MHGETAAVASFSRRLVKEKEAGRPLKPIIDQMNALARQYRDQSRPIYCALRGFVDEVVNLSARWTGSSVSGSVWIGLTDVLSEGPQVTPNALGGARRTGFCPICLAASDYPAARRGSPIGIRARAASAPTGR